MNNLTHEQDPHLEKIDKFIDNWRKSHNGDISSLGCHNIYLIQTEDRSGNITSEAFALNVMTYNYFWWFHTYDQNRPSFDRPYPEYLFIGDGEQTLPIPTTQNSLNHLAYGASATKTSNDMTRIENSTFYYDSDTGLLRASCWLFTGYFDYTLSNVTTDINITEIGLAAGNASNQLMTHAYVYDSEGQLSSIVKHPNEKLTITAYVRIFHKPGYIENKLWARGYGFAWNPWGDLGFGYASTYSWDSHCSGVINRCAPTYICSPRWYNSDQSNYYVYENSGDNRRAMRWVNGYVDVFNASSIYDSEHQIARDTGGFSSKNTLLEATDRYYDLLVTTLSAAYYTDDSNIYTYYCSQGGIIKPIRMENITYVQGSTGDTWIDNEWFSDDAGTSKVIEQPIDFNPENYYKRVRTPAPEEISTEFAACESLSDNNVACNFGYMQNSRFDVRGMLPVANMNISSFKSYNGLTHDWDIDETVANGVNTYELTMMQMYPWVGIYMNCKYRDAGVVKTGRQFVRIYFNLYTDYPITSISTSKISAGNIWCSDEYWNPNSWEWIPDPTNIPAELGTKRYYMGFGGSYNQGNPNYNTSPVEVKRSGYTLPTVTSFDETIRIDSIDTASTTSVGNSSYTSWLTHNYISGRRHIANDDMGYIWMSDQLYYPDDTDLSVQGHSWKIKTSQPTGNLCEPIRTLRFTEPSGHRILQIFRASNTSNQVTLCLQKISVFDIPSKTQIEADPTLEPTEYVLEPGHSISNGLNRDSSTNYAITSTETGYVVIGNPTGNRIHIINILGDEESNYEPTCETLTDSTTGEEIATSRAWAIKYTSNMVFIDPRISTDTDHGFTIYDMSTKTIVNQFFISKDVWSSSGYIRWITGWKHLLYISGPTSDDYNGGTWRCRIYDGTRSESDRVFDPAWSNALCRMIIPGGDMDDFAKARWTALTNPHTYGDEDCIIGSYNNSNWRDSNPTVLNMYYIDPSRPSEPVNFTSTVGLSSCGGYNITGTRPTVTVGTFNQGKQRIISVEYPKQYSTNIMRSAYFDANWIRDNRKGPSYINNNNHAIPELVPLSSSFQMDSTGHRASVMYKGKLLLSEYSTSGTYSSGFYQINTNYHRFVDPGRLLHHKMTGTTTTLQAYNNPKRIYGIRNVQLKWINSADIWNPDDMRNKLIEEQNNQGE